MAVTCQLGFSCLCMQRLYFCYLSARLQQIVLVLLSASIQQIVLVLLVI